MVMMGTDRRERATHIMAATSPSPSSPSSMPQSSAAMELLRLLGFVLDSWSRHRDSLQSLAAGGEVRGEEARVVERLGCELRELCDMMVVVDESSSSSSCSGRSSSGSSDGGDEVGQVSSELEVRKRCSVSQPIDFGWRAYSTWR